MPLAEKGYIYIDNFKEGVKVAIEKIVYYEKNYNKVSLTFDTVKGIYQVKFNSKEEETFQDYKEASTRFESIMKRIP